MSNVNPETTPFFAQVVGQLFTVGMLAAIQLQSWLVLRLTNPGVAYARVVVRVAALGRSLRPHAARSSAARHRDRTR